MTRASRRANGRGTGGRGGVRAYRQRRAAFPGDRRDAAGPRAAGRILRAAPAPMPDPLPEDPTPTDPVPAEGPSVEAVAAGDPGGEAPPPRDISGLIGPTLVGMVAGVAIVLLLLWLT